LVVDIREIPWSGSNIYWEEVTDSNDPQYPGYLTFDKKATLTASDPLSSRYYQGVAFKWGSLVGVSPGDRILYIPPVNGGSWISYGMFTAHNLWPGTKNLANVPYMTTYNLPGYGANSNYLYLNPDFTNYKGDICNYLDADWRMPNTFEFTGTATVSTSSASQPNDATGKGSLTHRFVTIASNVGPVILPSSGYVNESGAPQQQAYYFTGTSSGSSSYDLNDAYGTEPFITSYGEYVRCVKKQAGE
jgi:hypothetical protein